MRELVFLLEERSAAEMLAGFLPAVLPQDFPCRYIVFEGKQDLEKQIVRRIRGYRNQAARFIVLRDKDSGDCIAVKRGLLEKCAEAGRERKSLVRIACHELESWYLADLAAVEKGLDVKKLTRHQNTRKYREPDSLGSPKRELMRLTNNQYQEISGSRAIAPHLDPNNPRSHSFAVFVAGVKRMAGIAL
jgi:hypothetical protein